MIEQGEQSCINYAKKPIYYYKPVDVPAESRVIVSDKAIGWSKDQKHASGLGYIDRLDNPNNYDNDFNMWMLLMIFEITKTIAIPYNISVGTSQLILQFLTYCK